MYNNTSFLYNREEWNIRGDGMISWNGIKNSLHRGKKLIELQYDGSSKAVQLMANMLVPITAAVQCMGTGLPILLDFLLFSLFFLGVLYVLRELLIKITKPVCKPYFRTVLNGIFLSVSLFIFLYTSVGNRISIPTLLLYVGVVVVMEHLSARSMYSFIKRRRIKSLPFITLIFTLLFNIGLFFFLFGSGIQTQTIETYLGLENNKYHANTADSVAFLWEKGTYQVDTLDYGMNPSDDLASQTIDLTAYLQDDSGLKQWPRQKYLGYDNRNVPLRGRIWYPEHASNCPVVFLVHGNHNMITESYLGYAYPGEHLASRGYVVVSVDENVCNYYLSGDLSGENAARAFLLLENMRQVQTYNESGILAGKLDYTRLALMGHSRGGEATSLAALYNELKSNPDVGYQRYAYNFSIRSVIAVAPTAEQYLPAGRDVTLTDVNYLLIQGANDSDVSTFMGMKQYNNIKFTGQKDCYKSYLYIAGANHGQFNTEWQQDYTFPRSLMLNKVDLMEGLQQRDLLKGYVTAFLDDTLLGNRENRSYFQTNQPYSKNGIYMSGYQDGSFVPLADYEEDIALETITEPNGMSISDGLAFHREQAVNYNTLGSSMDTSNHAAYLWWNRIETSYGLNFKSQGYDLTGSTYLQFDVADISSDKIVKSVEELLNFDVVIRDKNGQTASAELRKICTIYPTLFTRLYKLQLTKQSLDIKTELQTVRIPLETFQLENKNLDLGKVESITFLFNRQEEGRILLDNVGVSQ